MTLIEEKDLEEKIIKYQMEFLDGDLESQAFIFSGDGYSDSYSDSYSDGW